MQKSHNRLPNKKKKITSLKYYFVQICIKKRGGLLTKPAHFSSNPHSAPALLKSGTSLFKKKGTASVTTLDWRSRSTSQWSSGSSWACRLPDLPPYPPGLQTHTLENLLQHLDPIFVPQKDLNESLPRWKHLSRFYIEHCCLITKSCLILCHSMDCSPPGSSVHTIL